MSAPPPGYGTLPPDPNEPPRGPYPSGQSAAGPYPGPSATPAPYGQVPYGQTPSPEANTLKGLAVVSVVAGIIGIPSACCCWFLGWIPALVAVGTGVAGLTQLKNDPATDTKPFLIIGLVLGVLGLLLTLGSAVLGFARFTNDF